MLSIMLSYPKSMEKARSLANKFVCFNFEDILTWLGEGNKHPDKWIECVKMRGRLDNLVIENVFTGFLPIKDITGITRKNVIFHDNGIEVSFTNIVGAGVRGQMYDVVVYGHEGGIMNVRTAPYCKSISGEDFFKHHSRMLEKYTHYASNELRESLGYPRIESGDEVGYEFQNGHGYRVIDSNIAVTKVRTFGDPVSTVKLEFNDGTSSTAVCSENDEFNLDIGIGLCIAKRIIGPDFLNAIHRAKKLYVRQHKAEEKEKNRRIEERALEKRRMEKAAKRRAKREEKRIKREAAIMAEAMKLAEIREKNNDYNSEQKLD